MLQRQPQLMAFLAIDVVLSAFLLVPLLPCPVDLRVLGLWAAGTVLIESGSLAVPYFGRFSTATVWAVGCLGSTSQSPVTVTLALCLWYFGRTLFALAQGELDWASRLVDWTASLLILPVYLLVIHLAPGQGLCAWLAAALVYIVAHRYLYQLFAKSVTGSRFLEWRRLDNVLSPMRGLALCGAAGFLTIPGELWPLRALLQPMLYGFHLGAQNLIQVVRSQDTLVEIMQSEDRLRGALAEKDQARRQAQASAEERLLLERLAAQLSSLQGLRELVPLLGSLLGPTLRLSSMALFFSPTGQWDELELIDVESPERSSLQNFRLLGLGEAQLRQTQADQVARVCHPPLVPAEAGLLIPLGGPVLYIGRPARAWEENDYRWLGWVMDRTRPFVNALLQREQQQHHLHEAYGQTTHLAARLEGQRTLLECAERFSGHLDVQALWLDAIQWLGNVLPLEGAAVLSLENLAWGRPWQSLPELRERVGESRSCCYLAQVDRARWPFVPGDFGNVIAFPLTVGGMLALAFAGEQTLDTSDIELLGGVANLFGTALARASLHNTVVLAHRRLEESQELWLRTHKSLALAQMSAGVAHELNTPLGAIRLAIESTMQKLAETQQKRLQSALDACLRAQNIILRLGQMAAQKDSSGETTDLVQLGHQLLDQLAPKIRKGEVQVRLETPAHLVVPISREAAENLLLPLLLNAIEAVEEQPVAARQVLLRIGPGWWEVLDRGKGIPRENYTRITEPFFTTKRIGTNVGLGLAMVEQTCRQVGATLTFEPCGPDAPGMRFRVAIP